jgi:phospholipase C
MLKRTNRLVDAETQSDIDVVVKQAARLAQAKGGATSSEVKAAAERLRRRLQGAKGPDHSVGGLLQDEVLKRKIRPVAVELWATQITCINDFDREWGRDEIYIGAITHDIYNNRDSMKNPQKVGEFGKKKKKNVDMTLVGQPSTINIKLGELPIGPGLWRDSLYFATVYLGEKDFGGMQKFMDKNGLSSKQFFELTLAMYMTSVTSLLGMSIAADGGLNWSGLLGGFATGVAPTLIPGASLPAGAVTAAIGEAIVGAVVHAVADEMFPPIVVPYHLYVPAGGSLDDLNGSGAAQFRYKQEKRTGNNMVAYDVVYEWRVRTALANDADYVIAPATEAKPPEGEAAIKNLDKIENIVVVMLENRSFDQMLGFLKYERKRPDFVGAKDAGISNTLFKEDVDVLGYKGRDGKALLAASEVIKPHPLPETFLEMDGGHSILHVARQVFGDVLPNEPGIGAQFDPHWPENDAFPVSDTAKYLPEKMQGFARDALLRCHSLGELGGLSKEEFIERVGRVMGYHPAVHVPTYDLFATEFGVCKCWYSSFPGNTWVNRTIAMTGSAAKAIVRPKDSPKLADTDPHFDHLHWIVDNQMPFDERSFFQTLDAHTYKGKPIQWACYAQDVPSLLCIDASYASELKNRAQGAPNRLRPIGKFFDDAEKGTLPHVSWVDPNFMDVGEMKDNLFGWNPRGEWEQAFIDTEAANDDHPPIDVAHGQAFLMAVMRALMKSPQWTKTMLIVTYDEHGGFFDHMPPPPNEAKHESPAFTSLGARVPAFVVSPWVERQLVSETPFDHTSIIKTIFMKFCREAIASSSERVKAAHHLGCMLNAKTARFADNTTRGASMTALADGLGAMLSIRGKLDREKQKGVRRPPTELQEQLHLGRRTILQRVFKR